MDDLLDLNWSSPAPSNVKQPVRKTQKPKDAFADLLNSTSKPVDTSKLSLAEQQQMQQSNNSSNMSNSPWLTPIKASTPVNSNPTSSPLRSISPSTFTETIQSSTTTSSFEDLLNPFGNSNKKANHDKNTPLNQLRNQTYSTSVSNSSSQWDLDLLDSTLSTNTNNSNTNSQTLDPFEVDSLVQDARNMSISPQESIYEDDNPLGILAHPAQKTSSPALEPETVVTHDEISLEDDMAQSRVTLNDDEMDIMIVQLVDMGFSLQESKFAIEATVGSDLQAAIDLLLQNSETAQRLDPSIQRASQQQQTEMSQNERARMSLFSADQSPRVQQQQQRQRQIQKNPQRSNEPQQQQKRTEQNTENNGENPLQTDKIVTQAQEFGGFLYKNATSFLKTGREKVTKAVGDWQEQQRTQRINQMQEEQSGPVRPKWMTGDDHIEVTKANVEKFADDDDSENEEDMESERRKIQEMRRLQELKQREMAATAHKARQQQSLRKETLIKEEEIYVSPSRRRATPSSSGRSTPRSNGSPVQQQRNITSQPQTTPVTSTPKNKRTRPEVAASADIMAKVNKARNIGNEKFKLGQFGDAEEAYTRAIEMLPSGHDHHVLLRNNRAMARLKTGDYKKCIEDCDTALALARESGDGSSTSEGVVIQWRDQIVKALYRKAEAFENIEKYKDALSAYDELLKLEGTSNAKINHGMSRCRQALNPVKTSSSPRKTPPASSGETKQQDFMSMFDPSNNSTTATTSSAPPVSAEELSKSKAVTAMRAKAAEQEAQEAEKLEKTDDVNARLNAWKAGKEQNLRALLATLDTLLWPGAQWKGAQMSDLINPKKCKITYMKAIGKVHPDKLPSDVTVEQRMLASGIFSSLNEAWDSFKTQNQM